MKTGPGWLCQPVDDPIAYTCWRTTMSVGAFDSALKSPGPCGYERTLKASYVPRASTVGVTPLGGDAIATATSAAAMTNATPAARAECRRRLDDFISPPSVDRSGNAGRQLGPMTPSRRHFVRPPGSVIPATRPPPTSPA